MAYENTHIWAADTVKRQIEPHILKDIITDSIDYFYFGAVFPDTFSFSKKKEIRHVSPLLHGEGAIQTNEIIFKMLDRVKQSQDKNNFAFICGLLTHCAMDIVLHPIVFYFSGYRPGASPRKASKCSYLHWHYETDIDRRFNNGFFLEKTINPAIARDLVAAPVLSVSEQDLLDSLRIQITYFRRIHSRVFYMVYRMLTRAGLVGDKFIAGFYANLEADHRQLPENLRYKDIISGEDKEATLSGLMNRGIEMGVNMIAAAYDYYCGKIDRQIGERTIVPRSLETGQIGKTLADVRFSIDI
jgi:hypothetical protein